MLKITLIILLITNIRGEDDFCECSCEGTKRNVGIPICDETTGKCECKPGYSGKNCNTCIDLTPSGKTCKICDCPDKNNKCLDRNKFNDFINKLESLKNIDFSEIEPQINATEINDLKNKVDRLYDDLKNKNFTEFDSNLLDELKKDVNDVLKNIQDILNKYKNEDLLENDLKKLNDALKKIDDFLKAIEDLNDYELIDEVVKNAEDIYKNIENILDEHEKCLDVVNQFCNGKNASENLKDVIQEIENININEYFKRINKTNEDINNATQNNKINEEELNKLNIPNIPQFDEKTLKDNHKKLEDINNRLNHTENTIKNATHVLDDVKKKKNESDISKARAFNTILMAPVPEIQEIIDNITATIKNSSDLINELNANKMKIEKEMEKILSELKQKEDELKNFEERINNLESNLGLIVPEADTVEKYLNMTAEMKEKLLKLTSEYKKKREEYQEFERMLDEETPKIEAAIKKNIECLKEETEQVDQKIKANEELLDGLEKDFDNIIELVGEVDDVVKDFKDFVVIKNSLDKIYKEEVEGAPICPKYDLS